MSPALGPAIKLAGKCLFLATDAADNYWHWLTDVLQKLKVTEDAGMDAASFDWILVNSKARRFQQESLSLLGIPLDKIVETDVHTHIHAEHLVVPSWAEQSGFYDRDDLEWLRERLMKRCRFGKRSFPKRFIMSRAKAKYRTVLNERDLCGALEQSGFVPVELEALSFAEQIQLFSGAEGLIGPHGAGFANIMFSQQGTKVLEFVNPNFAQQMFYYMASVLCLDYQYLLAKTSGSAAPQKQDLEVDVGLVKSAISSW
jgi:capsular polysaccharide biosynthesis protein